MPASRSRRFAALWRGINVGKAKRMAMADLRALLSKQGFTDVQTLLNSGNAVFTVPPTDTRSAAELESAIGAAVARTTGVTSRVMLLSAAELGEIIADNPLPHALVAPPRYLIAVLGRDADRDRLAGVPIRSWPEGTCHVGKRAVYLWCPDGISRSEAPLALDRALKDGVTSRNWATLEKLRALL